MKLGVCYYPEHWSPDWWKDDAQAMASMGISYVRIGEFAWSRIEPTPGIFDWAWLDRAVETLHQAGLKLVMCTPTATPPKWVVDADPEMLAVDAQGHVRGFGSRRHYCFSSPSYHAQSARITTAVAWRYGQHPAVVAWQTDNEYGCHSTVLSYSKAARSAFRLWLQEHYGTVDVVNAAWGTVFWSQEYRSFEEIDPPVSTVTEANPAHQLDYRRFASDEVIAFNRIQVEILRRFSPGRDVVHNFMGFFTEFDHHDLSQDLDVATWDSYPLGFTQDFFLTTDEKVRYARTGHPDIPAFHHDLYRGMCQGANRGRWWVMEQQPGPVNWAQWNPAPLDGMVRLWTWQAFAHGAEVVSYFRWRQAPFAQEQMHTGLQRPDRSVDRGGVEAAQVHDELQFLQELTTSDPSGSAIAASVAAQPGWAGAKTALVMDYPSLWMAQIQPQGADFNALELVFRVYSALRSLGLDVDIVSSQADLPNYRLIVLPAHMRQDESLCDQLQASDAQVVLGPRSGSKAEAMCIPDKLAPGAYSALAGLTVQRVSSLPPGWNESVHWGGGGQTVSTRWREDIVCSGASVLATFDDGMPAFTRHNRTWYVATWLDRSGWERVLKSAALAAGLAPQIMPEDLRVNRWGQWVFVFNFSNTVVMYKPEESTTESSRCVLGSVQLAPQDMAVWQMVSRP